MRKRTVGHGAPLIVALGVKMDIRHLHEISEDIHKLAGIAKDEGHNNIRTLVLEYESGQNRFQKPGEALFAAYENEQLVGICGVNIDPYETVEAIARVRRLYVIPNARRKGVASRLMKHIEDVAVRHFHRIQLFTASKDASEFYIRLGYSTTDRTKVSHEKLLGA